LSGTTRVSRYQNGKLNLDDTEASDSEWQWHQLGHMQVCISLQTDNHANTPPLKFFTGWMPFLPPNLQRQSTEGIFACIHRKIKQLLHVTVPRNVNWLLCKSQTNIITTPWANVTQDLSIAAGCFHIHEVTGAKCWYHI